jgi:HEAT repeat protein
MLERDETVVRNACRNALEASWPTPALVPNLVEFLKSRDRVVRAYAARLLGRIGPEASRTIPALIAVLNERFDLELKETSDDVTLPGFAAFCAARALGQMGPSREAIAALIDVISPEKLERIQASSRMRAEQDKRSLDLRRLGKAGPPTSPDPVLSSEFARVAVAVQGLGEIGPPAAAAVPALISAYNNGWSLSQAAIPVALGRIAPNSPAARDAVAVLIRVLDTQDPSDRLVAAEALGHFGTDASAAVPKLRALQEEYRSIRDLLAKSRSVRPLPGDSLYLGMSIYDAAAKSLAALEAQSKADAGGDRH